MEMRIIWTTVSLVLLSVFPWTGADLGATFACMQSAMTCMTDIYYKIGIDSVNLQNYFAQLAALPKGQLQRPWNDTCSGTTQFNASAFNCFSEKMRLCDAGLREDMQLSADLLIQGNDVFRSYCAPGCENLAQRTSKQNNCLQNATEIPQNMTIDEKSRRCTALQNAVYCAADAGKGCEFTTNYLNISMASIYQAAAPLLLPVSCPLKMVSEVTTPMTTQSSPPPSATVTSPTATTVSGCGLPQIQVSLLITALVLNLYGTYVKSLL